MAGFEEALDIARRRGRVAGEQGAGFHVGDDDRSIEADQNRGIGQTPDRRPDQPPQGSDTRHGRPQQSDLGGDMILSQRRRLARGRGEVRIGFETR